MSHQKWIASSASDDDDLAFWGGFIKLENKVFEKIVFIQNQRMN